MDSSWSVCSCPTCYYVSLEVCGIPWANQSLGPLSIWTNNWMAGLVKVFYFVPLLAVIRGSLGLGRSAYCFHLCVSSWTHKALLLLPFSIVFLGLSFWYSGRKDEALRTYREDEVLSEGVLLNGHTHVRDPRLRSHGNLAMPLLSLWWASLLSEYSCWQYVALQVFSNNLASLYRN